MAWFTYCVICNPHNKKRTAQIAVRFLLWRFNDHVTN